MKTGFSLRLLRRGCFDYLVDLAGGEGDGSIALGFLAENTQHFRLRGSELDVIADAVDHSLRCAAVFDDKRPLLIVHTVEELAEIRAGAQRGYYNAAQFVSRRGAHKPSGSLSGLYCLGERRPILKMAAIGDVGTTFSQLEMHMELGVSSLAVSFRCLASPSAIKVGRSRLSQALKCANGRFWDLHSNFDMGFFGVVAATIASLFLHFYAKRNVSVEVPGRRRVIFSCTVAPLLALLWLLVALLIHVGISNQLAHQDCGFSPDPYVTLPNGYVVGSTNTYDGYFHAPGVETDVPVSGPGYMRSLIDLKFSPPYFRGTQFDFNTSKIRSFVFDTKTRKVQVSEQRSQGDRVCETSDKACLDAWISANNHALLDTDSYWAIYAKYRHHWPNYILIALIFLGEAALVLGVWKVWKRAMPGAVISPN